MTGISHSIADFLNQEFHNELALTASLSLLDKLVCGFYALAAVLVICPHIRQVMRYRHAEVGKGDFCHHAQYKAVFWRQAPLLYAFVINSKLLALSVGIDILGRLRTIHKSQRAQKRSMSITRTMPLQQEEASSCVA